MMEVEDREEQHFLTMEDEEDSVAGPSQCTCIAELSAERRRWLATLMRKQQSQCTKEAMRAGRKPAKEKARCGESSQARYTLSCSIQCSPSWAHSHGTA